MIMAHSVELRDIENGSQAPNVERTLYLLHREIYKIGWLESFKEGWRVIECRHGRCKALAYKVGTAVGGIAVVVFSGTSMMFGVLALVQGIDEYEEEGRAPIVGHLSEWTMQSLFSLGVAFQLINEVSVLGEWMLAQGVFLRFLEEKGHQEAVYAEYLEFLGSRPQTSLVALPSLPAADEELQEVFDDLEERMRKFSFFRQLSEGWKIVRREQSCLAQSSMKAAIVVGGLFLTIHIINYPIGIYWSGEQAIDDLADGENPSIGGHSLEWSVEWLATLNVIYYYMRDLVNVGRAKMIADLFGEKAHALMGTSMEMGSRVFSEMKKQVFALPRGFFFKIPSWIMFNDDKERDSNSD